MCHAYRLSSECYTCTPRAGGVRGRRRMEVEKIQSLFCNDPHFDLLIKIFNFPPLWDIFDTVASVPGLPRSMCILIMRMQQTFEASSVKS